MKLKVRKIELRVVEMFDERDGKKIKLGDLKYASAIKDILLSPGPNGQNSEEVAKSILTYGKLKEALARAADHVLLDKESYDYLIARLGTFRWGVIHEAVAELDTYLRGVKEEEIEVSVTPPHDTRN